MAGYAFAAYGPRTLAKQTTFGGILCAVGNTTKKIMSSNDGVKWYENDAGVANLVAVCWAPGLGSGTGRFCAISSAGVAAYSDDMGLTWSHNSLPEANTFTSICWSPTKSLFVAVCKSGTHRVAYSSNGISWMMASDPNSNTGQWQTVCWSPTKALFVAIDGAVGQLEMYSADGMSWSAGIAPMSAPANAAVCWDATIGVFCCASSTTQYGTSADGITFTPRTGQNIGAGFGPNSVCGNGSVFCAVGNDIHGSGNYIATSPTGVTWTPRTADENNSLSSIVWSPSLSLFILVSSDGTHRAQTSPTGTTWTKQTAIVGLWKSIAAAA